MKCVKVTMIFTVTGGVDLDEHTDLVLDELFKLEDGALTDADLSVDLSKGTVEVSIVGIDADFEAAAERARSAIQTAIHAAGANQDLAGQTPAGIFDTQKMSSDLVGA